ncbi:hypothetical protein Q5P01_005682 [Channa striata]|uniref:Uncharacterized protein n=1 Tax=Channa striata TaxID=64152 RepID=A0AA88T7L1_CHASR|nr:hypothetical protein Q5P01_005682 [Channa striata]
MADGHDRCNEQKRPLPYSSSPLSSPCYTSFRTWLHGSPLQPPWGTDHHVEPDQNSQDRHVGLQSSELPASRLYEELFCTRQSSIPLVPLASSLMMSCGPQSDVVKQGYLGKLEQTQRRYFVLKAGSHTGPSRLEWYKNQEKFTAMEKSAGKTALFGSSKQGVIYLRCCLGVSRIGSSRRGHTVALYSKDQTMMLVMEDEQEQDEWYQAVRKLMEEERKDEENGEGFEEEDDGYCTLPSAAFFKEVWPVMVKPRGLGHSKCLAGETRLCLTATSLILVRVSACNSLPSITIPLLSVRRFGHLDGLFFLELGRSAPNGPGEIWMEARDQENPAVAQNIHEVIRETVRALRALPDFSRSPTNHQSQVLLISKRSRPKHRDKLVNMRPLSSPVDVPLSNPEIQTHSKPCYLEPCKPDRTEPESSLSHTSNLSPFRFQQSSTPDTDSYMEMKLEGGNSSGCTVEDWEPGKEEERKGYMLMSPQVSPSSSVLPQDDYVVMASPHKQERSAYSLPPFSLQSSFNSCASDSCSPTHRQTSEYSLPHWLVTSVQPSETQADQSQMSISCSTEPQDDARQEQKPAELKQQPAQTSQRFWSGGSI